MIIVGSCGHATRRIAWYDSAGGDVEIECDTLHRKLVPGVHLVKFLLGLDQCERCERGRIA